MMDLSNKPFLNFIEAHLNCSSPPCIVPIKGDGSDRRFFRVISSNDSYILVYNPPDSVYKYRENEAYRSFSIHLYNAGLPVPKMVSCDMAAGLFLVEDLGNVHLQDMVNQNADYNIWKKAVDLLYDFHLKARVNFDSSHCIDGIIYDPPFVIEKELEYFREYFLNHYSGLNISWVDVRNDFFYLAEMAGSYSTDWVIHRDFQSRNLMIKDGKMYIIDYQGMRYGPPEYDLASFFIDPYVIVDIEFRKECIKRYALHNRDFKRERFNALCLCRNFQILAAFVYLGEIKKKGYFLKYIPYALKSLQSNQLLKNDKNLKVLRKIILQLISADKKTWTY